MVETKELQWLMFGLKICNYMVITADSEWITYQEMLEIVNVMYKTTTKLCHIDKTEEGFYIVQW